jgi:hypothetical protein
LKTVTKHGIEFALFKDGMIEIFKETNDIYMEDQYLYIPLNQLKDVIEELENES